jgi:putative ABC transport system permease protein
VSWDLARHSARYRIGHSAAVISPLMIAIAVLSSFAAVLTEATASVALTQDDSVGYYGLDRPLLLLSMATLIIGGPLVLALTGTAVTAFVAGPNRARGTAALVAAGATGRQIVTASVWEAIIHVVTAALLGTAITSTVAVATAVSFALRGATVAVVVPLGWVAAPAATGAGLILLATVLPTLASLTRSVRQELGVD